MPALRPSCNLNILHTEADRVLLMLHCVAFLSKSKEIESRYVLDVALKVVASFLRDVQFFSCVEYGHRGKSKRSS